MAETSHRALRRVVTVIVVSLIAVAGVFAYSNKQFLNDVWAANTFQPTAEITSLKQSLALTDQGNRVFLASHPTLDDAEQFNTNCAGVDHAEDGHILGCFAQDRIHLFNIQDERLAGIVEVTAAHELLHAVFQRIQGPARDDLVNKLISLYDEMKVSHPALAERMSVYEHLSRTSFANELHSVFATEAWPLPAWLEQHYAAWFADQQIISTFYNSFHGTFEDLYARSEALSAELESIRVDVEARREAYREAVEIYNAELADFKQRNEAYEFSSNPAEFYLLLDDFDARRAALNAEVDALNAEIARYETLRAELNKLSELNRELQSQMSAELTEDEVLPDAA